MLRATGLKGEIRVEVFRPRRIDKVRGLLLISGREMEVERGRFVDPLHAVVKVDALADRDAAEAVRGAPVEIDLGRAHLFALTDAADPLLFAQAVDDASGHVLGTVTDLQDNGAQTILAIAPKNEGEERLVPFVDAFVAGVEERGDGERRVRIRTIPGLFDEADVV